MGCTSHQVQAAHQCFGFSIFLIQLPMFQFNSGSIQEPNFFYAGDKVFFWHKVMCSTARYSHNMPQLVGLQLWKVKVIIKMKDIIKSHSRHPLKLYNHAPAVMTSGSASCFRVFSVYLVQAMWISSSWLFRFSSKRSWSLGAIAWKPPFCKSTRRVSLFFCELTAVEGR